MRTPADTSISSSPPAHRLLRAFALIGLVLSISFLVDLFLLSRLPTGAAFMQRVLRDGFPAFEQSLVPILALIVASLVVVGYAVWRLRDRPRTWTYSGGLIATVVLVNAIVLYCWAPRLVDPVLVPHYAHSLGDSAYTILLAILVPSALALGLWRLRSWTWVGVGYVGVVGVFVYLAQDEPAVLHPTSFAEISPTFPGAEASYDVLMRYGKKHPLGKGFREPKRIMGQGKFVTVGKPAEWPSWLVSHRADVEADWADLAPVRAWMDELNRFDRIGDLMPAEVEAEIITFGPLRAYANRTSEIAGLQALDGHGDAAIATLLPLVEISRKLEPSARSLVRAMAARVMQRVAINTVRFVLDTTAVSPAMRARLADSLKLGVGGEPGLRHLLAIDHTFFVTATANEPLGTFFPMEQNKLGLRRALNVASPFLFNYRRTANRHQEVTDRLQVLALHRDVAGLQKFQDTYQDDQERLQFKNFMGDFFVGTTMPAYFKVVEAYWDIEGHRVALIARLSATPPLKSVPVSGHTAVAFAVVP